MDFVLKQNETESAVRSFLFQIGTDSICDQYDGAPAVGSAASKKCRNMPGQSLLFSAHATEKAVDF